MKNEYADNTNTKAGFNDVIKYAASSVYTTIKNLFRYEDENELSKEDKLELERVINEEKAFKARIASNSSKKGLSGKYRNDSKSQVIDKNHNKKPVKSVQKEVQEEVR